MRTLYPADRALRRPACSTSATGTRSTGRRPATPTASPWCSCTAAPAAARTPSTAPVRPGALPHRAARPADVRPVDPARGRPRRRPVHQHHVAPGRRPRGAAHPPGRRPLAGVRRVVGLDPRARVRADPPGAGDRAGAARHLHAAPPRAGLVLRGRRGRALPRPVGGLRRTDPARRAPVDDEGLPPGAVRPRPGGAPARRGGLDHLGGLDGHPAAAPRAGLRDGRAAGTRSRSPGSRTTSSCTAGGWPRGSSSRTRRGWPTSRP